MMGYNRSGHIRKLRLRRRKREMERLAARQPRAGEGAAAPAEEKPHHGLLDTVKDVAKGIGHAVGELLHHGSHKTEGAPPQNPS
jgi:hypothetical protein